MSAKDSTIVESELVDSVQNKAIKVLHIIQQTTKKFRIVVNLTWKEGDFHLITQRKAPREWASLDRLTQHIQDVYGPVPYINLVLLNNLGETKNAKPKKTPARSKPVAKRSVRKPAVKAASRRRATDK